MIVVNVMYRGRGAILRLGRNFTICVCVCGGGGGGGGGVRAPRSLMSHKCLCRKCLPSAKVLKAPTFIIFVCEYLKLPLLLRGAES